MTTLQFFERQTPEAQYTMYRMAKDYMSSEVIDAMKYHNVDVTPHQIAYYRRTHGINNQFKHVVPADEFVDRVGQYIDAVDRHNGNSWSNRSLRLKGAIWSRCATKMRSAGMIRAIDGTRPVRYEQCVGMDAIRDWYSDVVR